MVSKAPSFKPDGLSSLPVSPGPELVTVVRGLRGYDGPSHGARRERDTEKRRGDTGREEGRKRGGRRWEKERNTETYG